MFGSLILSLTRFAVKTPQIQPVRYKYHAEKVANKDKWVRRYGYKDPLKRSGLLPHYSGKEAQKIKELPTYK